MARWDFTFNSDISGWSSSKTATRCRGDSFYSKKKRNEKKNICSSRPSLSSNHRAEKNSRVQLDHLLSTLLIHLAHGCIKNLWTCEYKSNSFPLLSTHQNIPFQCSKRSVDLGNMINPKKLMKFARKWQKLATIARKRISCPSANVDVNTNCSSYSTSVADKGHFVVYSTDRKRYVFPMKYLNNDIFRALLELSEEEFGLPSDGPIKLPCDAVSMDYVVSLIQRGMAEGVERALLLSIATSRWALSCSQHQEITSQQLLVCSF